MAIKENDNGINHALIWHVSQKYFRLNPYIDTYIYVWRIKPNDVSFPFQEKRSRKRNVIWFNPPFSANVATNIGRKFLKAIDECFPKGHPLHKICNRNTLSSVIVACPT